MNQVSEIPSGFSEVRSSDQILRLTRAEMPWLTSDREDIPLAKISLKGGGAFYLGSAIRDKRLIQAADALDKRRSEMTNSLFYTHIPDFVNTGRGPYISLLGNSRSEKPIFYIGNKSGQRVYFMPFDRLQGIPVIIRVAACDKNTEGVVLGVLTTSSHKWIKHSSKL